MKPTDTIDTYTLRARLLPALLVLLPVWVAALTALYVTVGLGWLSAAGVVGIVFAVLLAHEAGDAGRAVEADLFTLWGGAPTVLFLAYRTSPLDRSTLNRYHARLRAVLPDLCIPETPEEEARDFAKARAAYGSAVRYLRNRTRVRSEYHLVFDTNAEYGYRRNTWALRKQGIASSVAGVLLCTLFVMSTQGTELLPVLAGLVGVAALCTWLIRVRVPWVRAAADRYARSLLETIEGLRSTD